MKAALVTGAASGIGRAIAERLESDGWDVHAVDLDDGDLTTREGNRAVVDAALARFGRLDAVVANAGFQHVAPIPEFPEDRWDALIGGGAAARVPEQATPFGRHRRAPFNYLVDAMSPDAADDEVNTAWARGLAAALKPFSAGSAYLNFIGEEGQERVCAAFGAEAYRRLQALKDRYDPDNLLRLNQNIWPSAALRGAPAAESAERRPR
jgi:hypothetical protein